MDLFNPTVHYSTCRVHFIILLFDSHSIPDSESVNRCFVSHWLSGLHSDLSKTLRQSVIPTLVWLFFSYPFYSWFWFWWFWLYCPTIFTLYCLRVFKNILKIIYLKNYYFSWLLSPLLLFHHVTKLWFRSVENKASIKAYTAT